MTMPRTLEEALEEISFLRRELGLDQDKRMVTQLAWAYGLSRNQARMLTILYQRRNRTTSSEQMMEALYRDDPDAPETSIIRCQMRHIRIRFGLDRITTSYMLGYQLTGEAVMAIEAAMRGEVRPPEPAPRKPVNRIRNELGHFIGVAA